MHLRPQPARLWQSRLLPDTDPNPAIPASGAPALPDTSFFGHPRGLATLFFMEMWERFSYYGMRALLILFMTADLAHGGMTLNTPSAAIMYGLYTSTIWLLDLPGR